MYKITASYDRNGTTTDTSNAESLGDYYGHEFETEMDAGAAIAELEGAEAGAGLTFSVEDIGITETEVAAKSGAEWWARVVGDQTPAEFMERSESAVPSTSASRYLTKCPRELVAFHDHAAKQAMAGKLVEVIEAQGIESIDYVYQGEDLGEHSGAWTGPRAEAIQAAVDALDAEGIDGDYVYHDEASDARWVNTGDDLAKLGAALLDGHSIGASYSLWCAATGGDEYRSQWDALSADAALRGMDVSEDIIVFAANDGGGLEGWLTLNDGVIYVCEGGERCELMGSPRTIAEALPGLEASA